MQNISKSALNYSLLNIDFETVLPENKKITEIKISEADYSVIDFETTGTSSKSGRVIEIGITRISNFKIVDTYQSMINPGLSIPYFITQLTGISDQDVSGAPYFEDIAAEIIEFMDNSIITAHNLAFDYGFLKSELERNSLPEPENEKICTLKLARKLYPELKSKSLSNLTNSLKIRHKNIHRALGDSNATAKLLLKMIPKLEDEFHIKTVKELVLYQSSALTTKRIKFIKKKLIDDYNSLPDSPGVYIFQDPSEETVYIGKAKSLKKRVRNYFTSRSAAKTREITKGANKLTYHKTNSELTALIAETELVKKLNPTVNTQLKKYPSSYFIKINKDDFSAYPIVTKDFELDGFDYFGPYKRREFATEIVSILNKTFRLRECSDKEFKKSKGCYLIDIDRCIAPCLNDFNKNEYNSELEHLYKFFAGNNQTAVNRLISKMQHFSQIKRFEIAAEYRDTVNHLLSQFYKTTLIREPINRANALIKIVENGNEDYILLQNGRVVIRNFVLKTELNFDNYLFDYFDGNTQLYENNTERDIERLRILLSWITINNHKTKVYYLTDYNSKTELELAVST